MNEKKKKKLVDVMAGVVRNKVLKVALHSGLLCAVLSVALHLRLLCALPSVSIACCLPAINVIYIAEMNEGCYIMFIHS